MRLERELDRDAQVWVNGDPGKQKLWDKAKAWRRVNQRELCTAVLACHDYTGHAAD